MIRSIYNDIIPSTNHLSIFQSISFDCLRKKITQAPFIRDIFCLYNSMYSVDKSLHSTIEQKTSYNKQRSKQLFGDQVLTIMTGMEGKKTIDTAYNSNEIKSIHNKIIANCPETIEFNELDIDRNKIVNGLCSAMTLTALRYLLTGSKDKQSQRLKQIAKEFKKGVPQIVAETQAVFNAIQLRPEAKGDLKRDKMQSLANVFDLELTKAYPIIYGIRNPYEKEELIEQLKTMPEGAYCIRLLWTTDNYKGEIVGHSLIYLKKQNEDYLFDPGMALILLNSNDPKNPQEEHRAEKIAQELKTDFDRWGGYDEIRFYEVNLKAKL